VGPRTGFDEVAKRKDFISALAGNRTLVFYPLVTVPNDLYRLLAYAVNGHKATEENKIANTKYLECSCLYQQWIDFL